MVKSAPIFNAPLSASFRFPGHGEVATTTAPPAGHTTAIISEEALNWFLAEDDSVILSEE